MVQPASIDEFYLDLSGTERLLADETLTETATRIRLRVLEETEISVSVGGGTTRTVAKLATRRAKPGGVHVVAPGGEQAFLDELDLAELPGVGPSLADALRARGLVRVADARRVERSWLCRWFGEGRGAWLHDRVRGVDPTPVSADGARRSVSSERTFAEDIAGDRPWSGTWPACRRRRAPPCGRRAPGPHGHGEAPGRRLHHPLGQPHRCPTRWSPTAAIFGVARGLLEELRRRRRTGARLLGVGLSGLVEDDVPQQLGLFEEEGMVETERDRALARVMDDLAGRFGEGTVVSARTLDRDRRDAEDSRVSGPSPAGAAGLPGPVPGAVAPTAPPRGHGAPASPPGLPPVGRVHGRGPRPRPRRRPGAGGRRGRRAPRGELRRRPLPPRRPPPETVAALAVAVRSVVDASSLPVGVNALRNDARAALGVAVAAGARFIRVNVHAGVAFSDQGMLEGRAWETLRLRRLLDVPVAVLADVHVKHAVPPPGVGLEDAARDAWERGLADGLLCSGRATGSPTDPDHVRRVKAAVPDAPVWVASGVTPEGARGAPVRRRRRRGGERAPAGGRGRSRRGPGAGAPHGACGGSAPGGAPRCPRGRQPSRVSRAR